MENSNPKSVQVNTEIADCYQGLFNHLSSEHNLTLTITEMDEIIRLSLSTVGSVNSRNGELADIRNKLSPISNLVAMLESSELMYHHDTEMHKLIETEIEQVKKSVEYLSNKTL